VDGRYATAHEREGFALFVVVILLFAVGVLGATGYQVAVLSSELSLQGKEGQRALSVARAGVQRYMTEQRGVPADTATYAMNDGDAIVTSRLVAQTSDTVSLYLLKSEGIYVDPISDNSAARRTVYQFAEQRVVPFDFEAVVTLTSGSLVVSSNGTVDGDDQASGGACEQDREDIAGALIGSGSVTYSGNDLDGSPDTTRIGSYASVIDSIGLAWDILTDPSFTPDYDDRWPGFLPFDSFPVVRFSGNKTARWGESGRGVLIVEGKLTPRSGFSWQGIVMAEEITPRTNGFFWNQIYSFRGLVVTGLGDSGGNWEVTQYASVVYDRCDAYDAGRSLAYFRPIGDAWWEGS